LPKPLEHIAARRQATAGYLECDWFLRKLVHRFVHPRGAPNGHELDDAISIDDLPAELGALAADWLG
jgi:hypothetical protein